MRGQERMIMQLPEQFIERTRKLLGEEEFSLFANALENETPTSVRINPDKYTLDGQAMQQVPWCEEGYYLDSRHTFTFDPLFHAGCYYVQEASSMFLWQAMKQYVDQQSVMLDLCAAPGGKSTLARTLLPEGSLLVSNEVMRNRSQILAENITKWGHPAVVVTNDDPADFTSLGPVFDIVLTDVPCSGEGMFRKDAVAVEEWSESNVLMCAERQQRILRDIWPCLKSGGLLIYSTCTFNKEENEDNVEWICRELGAEVLPVEVDDAWKITGNIAGKDFPVYRFLPHKTTGEGLFMAVLRKIADEAEADFSPKKDKSKKKAGKKVEKVPAIPAELKQAIENSADFVFRVDDNVLNAFPAAYEPLRQQLKQHLKILCSGINVAEMKGRDWQPAHSLAMSICLKKDLYPVAELSYEQAIAYLRREAVVLDADTPRGYVLLTFKGKALGFVKNIGNRANNLYPQEWRIRSGYLPEEIRTL